MLSEADGGLRAILARLLAHRARDLWLPVLLSLAALAIHLHGGDASEAWRFESGAISAGEPWRALTGHLTHLSPVHLVLNVAGLWLVVVLFPPLRSGLQLAATLGSLLALTVGFMLVRDPGWYVGLSGLLHGWFAAALPCHHRAQPLETRLLAVGFVAKLLWEQVLGPLPFTESSAGGAVVVDAHLFGAVGGVVAGALWWWLRRPRPRPTA